MKSAMMDHSSAFLLKGSLFTLTAIQLLQTDRQVIAQQLEALVSKSPNFFKNAPIVIDLEKIMGEDNNIDFPWIKAELLKCGLVPVGVRNANLAQRDAAITAGLGILSNDKHQPAKTNPGVQNNNSRMISQPIRSGQQVYAKGGDLIVLSSVSPGAELLADGHIHVYGTLRGRAIAGASGDTEARIFCQKLEAELISIAGFYKLNEHIEVPKDNHTGFQVYLSEGKLSIEAI